MIEFIVWAMRQLNFGGIWAVLGVSISGGSMDEDTKGLSDTEPTSTSTALLSVAKWYPEEWKGSGP